MINAAMTLGAIVAAGLSTVFVIGLGAWAPSLIFLQTDLLFAVVFILFCASSAIAPSIDAIAIAHRKAHYALGRGLIFNALRLPIPVALMGVFGSFGLFFPFLLGLLVSALVAVFVFAPRLVMGYRPAPTFRFEELRPLLRFSVGNHLAYLLSSAAPSLLPLLVVEYRSSIENAWFYVAWTVGTALYVIPGSFATSLFAEGSQVQPDLRSDVYRALYAASVILLPAGLVLYFFGNVVLAMFGVSYAAGGFELLRWLVLATPFVLVNGVYLALIRIEQRVKPIIAVAGFVSAFALGASWFILPIYGLPGVGLAWLLSQGLVTIGIALTTVAKVQSKP